MEPLAIYGRSQIESNTNLSRSLSISILDENGNEIPFETTSLNPIEFFIPRMILTNETFNFVNLTTDLPNFSYRFVYKFDKQSSFTNSIEVNNQSYFTFMIDNQQTVGHRTLILRFRKKARIKNTNIEFIPPVVII